MSNHISINPPSNELTRGSTVKVPIALHLDNAAKVRGIHADFHGAEETKATYTTTSTNGKGQTTTTTHTAVEHVTVVEQKELLAGRERAGCLLNMGDAIATLFGGGRHELMPPGDYKFEVELTIPDKCPASHAGDRSRVFYELTVQVDIPMGRDLKTLHSFSVVPIPQEKVTGPVRVSYPNDEGRSFWDKLLGPDVKIELALAADRLARGESVDGIFQVETDKPVDVQAIRARLIGRETSEAHGHTDSYHFKGDLIEIASPGGIQGSYSERFSLSADSVADMPPTANGKLFAIDWFVQIELDVPWAKDPTIRAPIVLLP